MLTANERELIQILREADEETLSFMWDLLCCISLFGDKFIEEAMAVKGDRAATIAVVSKWKATVREWETI